MYSLRLVVIQQLFLLALPFCETLKIGISKPLPITSPMPPTTTSEILTEEASTESVRDTTEYLVVTTMKPTTLSDTEWPDFPPKKTLKTSNKTTTETPSTPRTIKPLTSTVKPTVTIKEINITQDPATYPTAFPKRPNKQKYCFCDLIKEACDINCCCDHDCSLEALKVFRCQLETPVDLELQEGRFEDLKFQHGLPSCEVNDGWLCVFRANKPVAKEEGASYSEDTSRYYKWPNLLLESEDVKQREFYKYGDLMRIINIETKEIQNFDLPSSFESSSCRITEPIYYLKTNKRSCLMSSDERLRKAKLKLLQLEEKYKIFNTPFIPDDVYNNKHLEKFVGNITIYKCLKTETNCTRYQQDKPNKENFAMFAVKVNILHNFTHIKEVKVDLWLDDLQEEKSFQQDYYWLSYETEFFTETSKEFRTGKGGAFLKPPIVSSGPLGYLQGKPLIVARYEPFNRSQPLSEKNQVLNYFSPNNTDLHVLSLLAKENGMCERSKSVQDFISYGINAAYYCKVKLENNSNAEEDLAKTNFTEKCLNLQQHIHAQLFGQHVAVEDLSSYFISQLGKPQNNSNYWLQLQVYNTDFDAVLGQYLHETNTFVCRNILLSLSYEFHMATSTVDNIPLQNVIKRAVLHLDERHDLEFSLQENLEVPVTITVRFYDGLEKAASAGCNLLEINIIFSLNFCFIIVLAA